MFIDKLRPQVARSKLLKALGKFSYGGIAALPHIREDLSNRLLHFKISSFALDRWETLLEVLRHIGLPGLY